PCSSHTRLACFAISAAPEEGGMPMNRSLASALSEFSKGEWATEPLKDPPPPSTEGNLVRRSWLDGLARYLIAFFIGVVATSAWQSYRDGSKIDKLAIEIAKMQAVQQGILEKIISTPPPPRPKH